MDEARVLATRSACQRPRGARHRARRSLRAEARRRPPPGTLMLATTEAVANAVEHGKPCDPRGIHLRLETRGRRRSASRCATAAASSRSSRARRSRDQQGGRGMPIIATIMDKLEVAPSRDTTRVRFEKRLRRSCLGRSAGRARTRRACGPRAPRPSARPSTRSGRAPSRPPRRAAGRAACARSRCPGRVT